MVKGLPGGRARIYGIGLIALLAVAILVVFILGGLGKPARSYGSPLPSGSLTAFQQALQGIGDDGSFSKDTALRVFAAAFGPLPGVDPPPRDTSYRSGTAALEMVEAYWSELTTNSGARSGATSATARMPSCRPSPRRTWSWSPTAATRLSRPCRSRPRTRSSPTRPRRTSQAGSGTRSAFPSAWWQVRSKTATPGRGHPGTSTRSRPAARRAPAVVSIPPSTVNDSSRVPYLRWLLLHEVWHCFEHLLVSYPRRAQGPEVDLGGRGELGRRSDHRRGRGATAGEDVLGLYSSTRRGRSTRGRTTASGSSPSSPRQPSTRGR